jgi:hypothetical protein
MKSNEFEAPRDRVAWHWRGGFCAGCLKTGRGVRAGGSYLAPLRGAALPPNRPR